MMVSLAERNDSANSLMNSLEECRRGKGSVTLVSGSIASGKTALLHAFAERATGSGARFLSATCSSAESDLSLGVIDQLFLSAKPEGDHRSITDGGSRALHRLCMAITDRNDGPLVIGIDDIEHADPDSQQCILYLARRLTASPVMLVLTTSADLQPVGGPFQAELLRQPQTSAIRLAPLTPDGVARVLAEYLEPADAERLATACHGFSGGNPLLVHALAEDHRASADRSAPLAVGDAFGRAFLNCLYRCDPVTLSVVRALAVLDGMGARLTTLVDMEMEPERVDAILRSLHTAGLLYRGHFRHPLAHAAVLQSLEPRERQRLHTRAARILYGIGSPAVTVADHLVAAQRVQDDWGVGVLKEAAEQRLSDGDVKSALDALNLAYTACSGEPDRVAVKSLMARAEWRIN
ncbi:MAG: AAA family ATPase, partial [Actinoplanes sp.]